MWVSKCRCPGQIQLNGLIVLLRRQSKLLLLQLWLHPLFIDVLFVSRARTLHKLCMRTALHSVGDVSGSWCSPSWLNTNRATRVPLSKWIASSNNNCTFPVFSTGCIIFESAAINPIKVSHDGRSWLQSTCVLGAQIAKSSIRHWEISDTKNMKRCNNECERLKPGGVTNSTGDWEFLRSFVVLFPWPQLYLLRECLLPSVGFRRPGILILEFSVDL